MLAPAPRIKTAPGLLEPPQHEERPGAESQEEDDDVIEPDIVARMLRDRRAQEILHAEEIRDEVHAVQAIHRIIPAAAHHEEYGQARQPAEVQEFAGLPAQAKENEQDEARQQEADGSFREDGEP